MSTSPPVGAGHVRTFTPQPGTTQLLTVHRSGTVVLALEDDDGVTVTMDATPEAREVWTALAGRSPAALVLSSPFVVRIVHDYPPTMTWRRDPDGTEPAPVAAHEWQLLAASDVMVVGRWLTAMITADVQAAR